MFMPKDLVVVVSVTVNLLKEEGKPVGIVDMRIVLIIDGNQSDNIFENLQVGVMH